MPIFIILNIIILNTYTLFVAFGLKKEALN